ncbi:hypothetical protein AB1L30_04675 [Bremerella sp. JC817]|uniref:hypothetical protein n=1 Tax=Bremerella sp. JC817 TaxID=3231756 RepID=UPI003459DECF
MFDPIPSTSFAPLLIAFFFAISGILAVATGQVFAQDLNANAIVELTTSSGRTFRGTISPKSDFNAVHLTTSRGSISLTRPIAWTAIRQLTIDEQPSSFENLAALINLVHRANNVEEDDTGLVTIGPSPLPREHEVSVEQMEASPQSTPPASLSAWATFKNWDSDPMIDGLEVTFAAEDEHGNPTSVRGHLEADLYTFQGERYLDVPQGQGAQFRKIGTWRIPLDQTFARYDSRVARLPYQSPSPITDGSISPYGTLIVRLVVPGQGTFTTSLDDVRLRPYSSIRDANQLRGNPRYFGHENPRYVPQARP